MSCFWRHKWGKWAEESRIPIQQLIDDGTSAGRWVQADTMIVQKRICAECGLAERYSSRIKY